MFKNFNPIRSIQSFLGNIFKPQPQPKPQPRTYPQPAPAPQPQPKPQPKPRVLGTNTNAPPSFTAQQLATDKLRHPTDATYYPTDYVPPSGGGQPPPPPPPPDIPGSDPVAEAAATMQRTGEQLMQDLANAHTSGDINPNTPFALDEFLARQAATQAISPYYAQTYARFKKGIQDLMTSGQATAKRGIQGIQQTGENQINKLQRLLQSGQQSTGEQYSGQGLYDSGERARAQGLMGATTSSELSNYLGGQQRDIETTKQQERDLLNSLFLKKQETENSLARNQGQDVEAAVQEAQRQAATQQGVTALEGQPLTSSNMQDYFNTRAKALSQFLPNA